MAQSESEKTPKLKGSDIDTETAARNRERRLQPGAQGEGQEGDALDPSGDVDPEKLKENQERLRQSPQHKTPEMEKKRRGSFP